MYGPLRSWETFLSTCPVRGTTLGGNRRIRGAGISIHVPREGHDLERGEEIQAILGFLSTCPVRGTTSTSPEWTTGRTISIHVPREGHDLLA